jgi:hypothetical protein
MVTCIIRRQASQCAIWAQSRRQRQTRHPQSLPRQVAGRKRGQIRAALNRAATMDASSDEAVTQRSGNGRQTAFDTLE